MKIIRYRTMVLWLCASTVFGASICFTQTPSVAPTKPPVAPVRPVTDDYYGTKIVDNYRYMENLKDPEVQEWFKNQNDYTRATLASIPGREKIQASLRETVQSVISNVNGVVRVGPGDLYFYQKRLPGENASKLYLRHGLSGEEKLLADPEKITLAASRQSKGKNAIAGYTVSVDGKYVAANITPGGSENDTEVHVIDVATGRETGDVILRAKHGVTGWLPDNRSFVYRRLQDLPSSAPRLEIQQKERVYLHVLGTDPQKDPAVFGYGAVPSINVDPDQTAWVQTSPGSQYAVGVIDGGVSLKAYYIEPIDALGKSNTAWHKFADIPDKITEVTVHADDLYVLTFKNASRYKILRIDARHPNLASAEVVVPPSEAVVTHMSAAQDALYVQVLDGGADRLLRVPYGPKPKVEKIVLPLQGSAGLRPADPRVPGILFRLSSWTKGPQMYAYDPQTKQVTNTNLMELGPSGHDDNLEAVEVKVKSYDGTLVPLSIVYTKGLKLDGSHPTVLTGYGAYGTVTDFPRFEGHPILGERGGVSATCGVRGGGEFGEDWHLGGKDANKPNTWRDFIACAEYLIEKKYTSPAHLAGVGGSAGGILIGRAITERPDLFRAAVITSGVLDALRNETTPNGPGNIPEFGSTKTEDGFKSLLAMSAYHHVTDHTPYPAVLLQVGMNDPRVDPWESGKMTARLQAATSSGKPVLLLVNYAGGHGGSIDSAADVLSFLLWQLGDPDFQPKAAKQ